MKTLGVEELREHLNEMLRLVEEEGETIKITNNGEVVARLVPEHEPEPSTKRSDAEVWAALDRLAAEIGAHWKGDMDAVEAVRDVRRDL